MYRYSCILIRIVLLDTCQYTIQIHVNINKTKTLSVCYKLTRFLLIPFHGQGNQDSCLHGIKEVMWKYVRLNGMTVHLVRRFASEAALHACLPFGPLKHFTDSVERWWYSC